MIALLVSLALRVAILGGIAGSVCALRRNASASERHLVWMVAIGSMLLLPIAISVLPAIEILALPRSTSTVSSGVIQDPAAQWLNWPMMIGASWLVGSLICLLSLAIAHARARGIVGRASYNERWSRAVGRSVMVSDESTYAFNYGIRNPAIVLPADSIDWPDALLRATLIHEAAHIERKDSLSLLVSQLARVVYWWHPVIWFAIREAAAERERACDDAVLREGCRPSEYGEHLLANGTRPHVVVPIARAAPLFSHTDGLARRISNLLDDGVDRRPVRRGAAFALLAIALPVVAVTASATPMPRPLYVAIETLSLGPVVAQAPHTPLPSAPAVSKKPKSDRRRKLSAPTTAEKDPPDPIDKKLAEGTWIVDGRVVDAASFPVDLKQMARLAASMGRLAGKMTVTIDSAKWRPRR